VSVRSWGCRFLLLPQLAQPLLLLRLLFRLPLAVWPLRLWARLLKLRLLLLEHKSSV
jgi:hypothetical protein